MSTFLLIMTLQAACSTVIAFIFLPVLVSNNGNSKHCSHPSPRTDYRTCKSNRASQRRTPPPGGIVDTTSSRIGLFPGATDGEIRVHRNDGSLYFSFPPSVLRWATCLILPELECPAHASLSISNLDFHEPV